MKPRERQVTVLRKWAAVDMAARWRGVAAILTASITPAGRKALAEAKGAKNGHK